MRKINVILASASPRRKELLNQIGIYPKIIPCDLEEKITSRTPEKVVEELSAQKAEYVWKLGSKQEGREQAGQGQEFAVVIGADTVVSIDGTILGKPEDTADAERMIGMLQGKNHQVYTGVTLIGGGRRVTFSEKTEVFVFPMSGEEIKGYVSSRESMDKAGAYGIQGRFAAFIEKIAGSYTNVMGLPAGRVYHELKKIAEDEDD